MPSLADMTRSDWMGFSFVDATGTAANGQLGPWTLSGSLTDPQPFRTATLVLRSSGTITTATITVQASVNPLTTGATWFPVFSTRADTNVAAATLNYAGGGTVPLVVSVIDMPARFLRVDVSALTGGGTVFADVMLSGD